MSKLICSLTMSLDGFVAGPNQTLQQPLGEGGLHLHDWVFPTRTFRTMHGEGNDGESGINDDVLREVFEDAGATIMGRNMFGPVRGPWGADPWKGWWGDEPPFHHPVFVLTHHAREPMVMQGGTTFHFVTDGIEAALRRAREVAGGRKVIIGGGASVVQQYLNAGLLDELEVHIVPQLLGSGERLLDRIQPGRVQLEPLRTLAGPGVVHLKYRVKRNLH